MGQIWLLTVLTLLPLLNASQCPGPNWKPRSGSSYCYLFSAATNRPSVSWSDAQLDCKARGGRLLDIENLDEYNYITSRLGNTPLLNVREYWTGLSHATGSWRWTDIDQPFIPNSVDNFNPNNTKDFYDLAVGDSKRQAYRGIIAQETNGVIRILVATSDGLFSRPVSRYYICKANYSSRPLCKTDEGWDYVHNRCWKSMTELADYRTASDTCLSFGGYVAVPSSAEENQRLVNLANGFNTQAVWIGLSFPKTAQTVPAALTWADGTNLLNASYKAPWSYPNIEARINELPAGSQYCASLTRPTFGQSKWLLEGNCNDKKPYSCETDLETCPYGWTSFMGLCYQFKISDDDVRNYTQAAAECTVQGGNLAVIFDPFLQLFIGGHIATMGLPSSKQPNFWFGYNSRTSQIANQYTWNTAPQGIMPTDYTNWLTSPLSSMPDPSRRCAYLQGNQGSHLAPWVPGDCSASMGYVCQARPDTVVETNVVRPVLKCDPPFTRWHEGCFFVSKTMVNWDQAKQECSKLQNSELVEIETGGENRFLTDLITVDSWIGVKRIGPYMNAQGQQTYQMQYSDGRNLTELSFTNYELIVSSDDHRFCYFLHARSSGAGSVIANTGYWDVEDCTANKPYICHHRGDVAKVDEPSDEVITTECGEGWRFVGNYCYKFNAEAVTYKLAEQTCRNQGPDSSLLYITSAAEGNNISALNYETLEFETITSFWTALQVTARDQWYWRYRNSEDKWRIPMVYTNWSPNQPNPSLSYSFSKPMCAYVRADQNLQWEAGACSQLRSYICKKPAALPVSPGSTMGPPPANYTYGCPAPWTKSEEHCYLRNDTYLIWTEARDSCRAIAPDSHLAAIYSAGQHQRMLHILNGAWIGMNSLNNSKDPRQFVNADNSEPVYTPWLGQIPRPGNPNSAADANCVASLEIHNSDLVQSLSIAQYSCAESRPYVCMLPLQALELHPADCVKPPEDKGCQRWGYGHRSSCFYMGNDPSMALGTREPLTFEGARRFCREYFGGDLAVINSADKQEFMSVLLGTWASEYWIGLRGNGNIWAPFQKWITNDSTAVANWAYGEPSRNHEGKGCVAMHGTRNDRNLPGDWYVAPCHEEKFALCEAPRVGYTSPPVVPTTFPSGCPNGWSTPDDDSRNCYKAFYAPDATPGSSPATVKLTWQEAEDSCVDFTGHLASVANQVEQTHILQKVLPNRGATYNFWIGLVEDGQSWKWSDGSPFLTTSFFDPSVNHGSSNVQDCVGMNANTGLWVKQNCEVSWGWVCEIPKGFYDEGQDAPTVHTPTLTNTTCGVSTDGDWFYDADSDNCFFVSKSRSSWASAETTCVAMNSHLATVEKAQHGFVTKILSRHSPVDTLFWIGLRLQNPVLMTHGWVDGNLGSIFRAWEKDEPNPKGVQGCVVMNNRNGLWKDDYCTRDAGYRFVCRKSKTSVSPATTVSPALAELWGCPSNCTDCIRFRDSCYYLSPIGELKTWDQSREICRQIYQHPTDMSKSSDLASIHDRLEQDFLFAHFGVDRIRRWIGLHEDWDKVTMFWSDQTPFDFKYWEGREPLWASQPECVYMYGDGNINGRNGQWNDAPCTDLAGYICEMKKDPTQPTPTTHPDSRCESGFEFLNGACFAVFDMAPNQEPQTVCSVAHGGARAATISNAYENAFVRLLFAKKKGEVATSTARAWLGGKEQTRRLTWDSGCYPSFNNIINFYTTNTNVNQTNCIAMNYDGTWVTQACTNLNIDYVVCEKRPVECAKLMAENNGTCPVGFDDECHDYCYKITHSSSSSGPNTFGARATWTVAKSACAALNASIVSIRNENEQKCLEKYVESSVSTLWLGLYEDYDVMKNNGTWKWLDQNFPYEGNYMNWQIGEPNDLDIIGPSRESCTEIMPNGRWNNVPCGLNVARGYICEKAKIPLPTIPPSTVSTSTTTVTSQPTSTTTQTTSTSTTTSSTSTAPPTTSTSIAPTPLMTTATPRVPTTNPPASATSAISVPVRSTDRTDIGVEDRTDQPTSGGLGSGSIAGLAVSILILVPAVTILAYFLWKRREERGRLLSSKSMSFRGSQLIDRNEDGDDSYT